jgi:hypothetical protein
MTHTPHTGSANGRRARRIDCLLARCDDGNAPRESLIDLLADARHWCDRHEYDFADLDRVAYQHYAAERTAADTPPPSEPACPTPYDRYEIDPCRRFEEPDRPGHFYCEACDPADADVWTLYGHVPGRGVEAIGDFATRAFAAEIYARITGRPYDRGDAAGVAALDSRAAGALVSASHHSGDAL